MKVGDLSPKKIAEFTLPVLTAGIENQGLNNYAPRDNATILKNVISISANGANTGATFYQNKEFTVLQDAYAISFKEELLNDNQYLFLTGAIAKSIYGNFAWTDKAGWEKVKKEFIQLPTKDGKIDFEFMDACIRELEEERIRELSAYLTVSGLDNYELSSEEKESLEKFNLEIDTWKLFKVQDVFDVRSSKKRFDANKVEILNYGFPYIVRMSTNNGIKGYINQDEQLLNQGNTIAFGQDTATMFYQENPYFTGDKIKILECKYDNFNKINSMFLISVMRKSFSTFSWGANSFSEKVINNQEIKLPTKDGKIDFEFMELLISAVQKLVIKDVVLYADEKIQSTKKIVKES